MIKKASFWTLEQNNEFLNYVIDENVVHEQNSTSCGNIEGG